jgi:FtsZ-binding cell division protein ZapB
MRGIIANFPSPMHKWAMLELQGCGVYCEKVGNPFRESAIMALDAAEQVTDEVPADDFQALEDKVYRTIERYKAARQALTAAERDAQRAREQLEERDQQLLALRRETVQLKKEREEIRGRVEKMLAQIESIAEERAS